MYTKSFVNYPNDQGFGPAVAGKGMNQTASPPPRRSMSPDQCNPAEPITDQPSQLIGRIGWALRTLLLSQNTCLKDRKVSGRLVRRCAPGTELVDWMLSLSPSLHTRAQAAGMWQALLEEGVISHVHLVNPNSSVVIKEVKNVEVSEPSKQAPKFLFSNWTFGLWVPSKLKEKIICVNFVWGDCLTEAKIEIGLEFSRLLFAYNCGWAFFVMGTSFNWRPRRTAA
ncbi:hypothetical protein GWI33_021916 [Rhynchophorus ferrugineus]|uniref:DEP domain-containing protein n=1 Tax=Rhynchophorus ferrugineus TaxID=354439 RepID=A0A834LYF5_RHYFE|nr:hypothetical protein GWI33_021916 [Rhynchophorus ferrugineus]